MKARIKIGILLLFLISTVLSALTLREGHNKPDRVIVAVVDTGLSFTHPLRKAMESADIPGWNFFHSNSDYHDEAGHGTAIAETIFDVSKKSAEILPLKISRRGSGVRIQDFSNALRYVISKKHPEHPAVINISFGVLFDPNRDAEAFKELERSVRDALNAHVFIVSAAGHGIPNPFSPTRLANLLPQALANVLVIAEAVTPSQIDPLTNYGPELDYAVPAHTPRGSSFSAAVVSGLLAHCLAQGQVPESCLKNRVLEKPAIHTPTGVKMEQAVPVLSYSIPTHHRKP